MAQTTVWVAVPESEKPVPSYYCHIRIQTLGGIYYAGRTLDHQGIKISDSIKWQSQAITDPQAPLTHEIHWWSDNATHGFETGMLNLYFRGTQAMTYFLRLDIMSPSSNTVSHFDAGPSGDSDGKNASAYIRLESLMATIGESRQINYRLVRLKKHQGVIKNIAHEGAIDIDAILSAKNIFPQIMPKLEALQNDYQSKCTNR